MFALFLLKERNIFIRRATITTIEAICRSPLPSYAAFLGRTIRSGSSPNSRSLEFPMNCHNMDY